MIFFFLTTVFASSVAETGSSAGASLTYVTGSGTSAGGALLTYDVASGWVLTN